MIKENQVITDLIALIKIPLGDLKLSDWAVLQNYQPTKGNYPGPYILVHRLPTTYIGQLQQNSVDNTKSGQLKQASFQLDAYKKRLPTDTADTLTGGDVLEYIRNWFMGDKAQKELRKKNYNVFRVGQMNQNYFETDTDTFQINTNFVLDLAYKQTYAEATSVITSADGTLVGI